MNKKILFLFVGLFLVVGAIAVDLSATNSSIVLEKAKQDALENLGLNQISRSNEYFIGDYAYIDLYKENAIDTTIEIPRYTSPVYNQSFPYNLISNEIRLYTEEERKVLFDLKIKEKLELIANAEINKEAKSTGTIGGGEIAVTEKK